jgi:hypothetical protein
MCDDLAVKLDRPIDSPLSSTFKSYYKEQRAVEKLSTDLLGGFSPSNTFGATVGLIRDEKPTLNTTPPSW